MESFMVKQAYYRVFRLKSNQFSSKSNIPKILQFATIRQQVKKISDILS